MGEKISCHSDSVIKKKKGKNLKSEELTAEIQKAFKSHFLFNQMQEEAANAVINAMEMVNVPIGTVIIKEGDKGDNCYYIESGKFACYEKAKGNNMINQLHNSDIFGDLALIYDCPRSCTVQAIARSVVWKIDRLTFRKILVYISEQERLEIKTFIKSISLFDCLTDEQLNMVVSIIQSNEYKENTTLLNESTWENKIVYLLHGGKCKCFTTTNERGVDDKNVILENTIEAGTLIGEEYFDDKLPNYTVVTTSNCVEIYSFNYVDFLRCIGNIKKVKERNNRINALRSIGIFQYLNDNQLEQIDEAFEEVHFNKGEYIIKEGEVGDRFYILKKGRCRLTKLEEKDGEMIEKDKGFMTPEDTSYFGELALLRDDKRSASVIGIEDVICDSLDRKDFIRLLGPMRDLLNQHTVMQTLKKYNLFDGVNQNELEIIAQSFRCRRYNKNDHIITQGTPAREFFIIFEGKVEISKSNKLDNYVIGECGPGDYLGEIGLISDELRTATAIALTTVDVFVISGKDFKEKCPPMLLEKLNKKANERKASDNELIRFSQKNKFEDMSFEDLEVIALLGTGVLGRVSLVKSRKSGDIYALKAMYKAAVVETKQQEAVIYEKNLLIQLDHPFILKLYKTFKDKNRLYMLMEYIQGGELYGLLQRSALYIILYFFIFLLFICFSIYFCIATD